MNSCARFPFGAVGGLGLLAGLGACSADAPYVAPTPAPGMSWALGDSVKVLAASATASASVRDIQIIGLSDTTLAANTVFLTVPKRVGTFPAVGDTTATTYIERNLITYEAVSGSIVVSQYQPSGTAGESAIVGSFTFRFGDSTSTRTISNGRFNLKF